MLLEWTCCFNRISPLYTVAASYRHYDYIYVYVYIGQKVKIGEKRSIVSRYRSGPSYDVQSLWKCAHQIGVSLEVVVIITSYANARVHFHIIDGLELARTWCSLFFFSPTGWLSSCGPQNEWAHVLTFSTKSFLKWKHFENIQ